MKLSWLPNLPNSSSPLASDILTPIQAKGGLSTHYFPMKKVRAFTLIELLTVIAIIGILAAILIPTVAAVRDSARAAGCISNLRQIGMAFNLYVNDNDDRMPPRRGAGWSVMIGLAEDLEPYAEEGATNIPPPGATSTGNFNTGVWRCPSAPEGWKVLYLPNENIWNGVAGISIAQVKDPTLFPLLYDRGGGFTGDPGARPNNPGHAWHGSNYNTVFADSSVRPVALRDLNEMLLWLDR